MRSRRSFQPQVIAKAIGAAIVWIALSTALVAAQSLDGRIFNGMIGPRTNPDLEDSLHFSDGHFWSDICTRCGFRPGMYITEPTSEGMRFHGVLESESRGRFTYDGVVLADGSIDVSINWERKRWYWTTKREIAFQGHEHQDRTSMTLPEILEKMSALDPDGNPMCARF